MIISAFHYKNSIQIHSIFAMNRSNWIKNSIKCNTYKLNYILRFIKFIRYSVYEEVMIKTMRQKSRMLSSKLILWIHIFILVTKALHVQCIQWHPINSMWLIKHNISGGMHFIQTSKALKSKLLLLAGTV